MSKRAFASRASESPGPAYGANLQVAEDIMPIAELKTKLGEVMRGLDARRPIVITLNGKAAGVLMSPREFDRLTYERRFVAAVREGLADADAGRVLTEAEVFDTLEAEFGPIRKRRRGSAR